MLWNRSIREALVTEFSSFALSFLKVTVKFAALPGLAILACTHSTVGDEQGDTKSVVATTDTNADAGSTSPATAVERQFRSVPESRLLNTDGQWGGVAGQVILDGAIPPRQQMVRAGVNICAAQFDESLIVDSATKGIANCFVYLKKSPAAVHPLFKQPVVKNLVQDLKDCQYVPHVMFIQVGQTIETISKDPVAHNVHWFSLKGQPVSSVMSPPVKGGDGKGVSWTPDVAEPLPIQVKCDFHSWMRAYWLILDHPYAAVTDTQGRFRIIGLPAGNHELRIWHERIGYIDRRYEITVTDGEVADLKPVHVNISKFK